jgi:hypothetical protein
MKGNPVGIFDFLRRPAAPGRAPEKQPAEASDTPSEGQDAGDLSKTEIIGELLAAPHEQRDEAWVAAFFEHVGQARFFCDAPQVLTGPDNFPYVRLTTQPELGKPFTLYVIEQIIPQFILQKGFGIAINPDKEQPDWVFSYGDLLNYHIYGAFDARDDRFDADFPEEENLHFQEQVQIGEPSPQLLPPETRQVLRRFFERAGVSAKVMLMSRNPDEKTGRKGGLSLVFPCTPDSFNTREEYAYFNESLGWFLPRHYSVISKAEDGDFFDL